MTGAERSGAALRVFRHAARLTQGAAADWWGVSERTWRRYERGETHVPRPLVKRIEAGAIHDFRKHKTKREKLT